MVIQAVIVDENAPGRLALHEVDDPQPAPSEATVRVKAISLNPGELRRAASAKSGWRPGWDIAGVVELQAADGSGPAPGTRVVGIKETAAWAELVAVPTNSLAPLPDSVSFAQAATLPVAGLTALRMVRMGGMLLNRKVLVTAASGSVGAFACQLARLAGAYVVGTVRRADREAAAREAGAHEVVLEDAIAQAKKYGPYSLVIESVGGDILPVVLEVVEPSGICVSFGASDGAESRINVRNFYLAGGISLYGFFLFYELGAHPAARDLGQLAALLAAGQLSTRIDVEASWTQLSEMVQQQLDRRNVGKIVLTLGE